MPVQLAISLTEPRASYSTTIFTAAMFSLGNRGFTLSVIELRKDRQTDGGMENYQQLYLAFYVNIYGKLKH